ncbi:MAG: hypothetical protein M1840_000226 [Geoglossum simile]|nr:MAG: hypothetical protein M1840_000226 [Geoglossum simile]
MAAKRSKTRSFPTAWTKGVPGLPIPLDLAHQFLAAVTGVPSRSNTTNLESAQLMFVNHVHTEALQFPQVVLSRVVKKDIDGTAVTVPIFELAVKIAQLLHVQEQPSIDSIAAELSVTQSTPATPDDDTRQLIFCILGWIIPLYIPISPSDTETSNGFRVDSQGSSRFSTLLLPMSFADRPIVEIVQSLGYSLLPVKEPAETRVEYWDIAIEQVARSFAVSVLNANILDRVGNVEICWVDTIASHLDFDLVHKKLYLYRLPSYCEIGQFKNSALAKFVDDYYDEFTRPDAFSTQALLREILLSFRLIFGDNSDSRSFYRKRAKIDAEKNGSLDPILDQLCGKRPSVSNPGEDWLPSQTTESYEKQDTFPLLTPRLNVLQKYILRQQPSRWRSLWDDRRDLTRWYTVWVVAIFGVLSVFLSIVQIILGAIQVSLGYQSLKSG